MLALAEHVFNLTTLGARDKISNDMMNAFNFSQVPQLPFIEPANYVEGENAVQATPTVIPPLTTTPNLSPTVTTPTMGTPKASPTPSIPELHSIIVSIILVSFLVAVVVNRKKLKFENYKRHQS